MMNAQDALNAYIRRTANAWRNPTADATTTDGRILDPLQDGQTLRVSVLMMDDKQRAVASDRAAINGRANRALLADAAAKARAVQDHADRFTAQRLAAEDAARIASPGRAEYLANTANAWRAQA